MGADTGWHTAVGREHEPVPSAGVCSVQAECSGEQGSAKSSLPLGNDETCKCAYLKRSHTIKLPGKAIHRTALAKEKMF